MVSNFRNTNNLNTQLMGLSTDTKPTVGVEPNALFWELDTNGMYFFDGTAWQSVGGSGGGGSSDFSTAEVNAELIDNDGYYLVHILVTAEEAKTLFNQNKIMKFTATAENCQIADFIGLTFYATSFGASSFGTYAGVFWFMQEGDTEYSARYLEYDEENAYYKREW